MSVKLTAYSHGAGCGCKLSPASLSNILSGEQQRTFQQLMVGNSQRDDAAVYDLDGKTAIISTTDFFMPIVDDPFDFGRISATNALSDIYAMGGTPIMAVSIFGWPVDKLSAEIGQKVIAGGRQVCEEAGIPLAGGHSIDSPEPIFGLAVTGIIDKKSIKANSGAQPGDLLYLTKPLGIGILTTAEKRQLLERQDEGIAAKWMLKTNKVGARLSAIDGVTAMTDVTGFGLIGHLSEICEASGVSAELDKATLPIIEGLDKYLALECIPGGTGKNYWTYRHLINDIPSDLRNIIFDPQTSGGLLITVNPEHVEQVEQLLQENNAQIACIGRITNVNNPLISIS